MAAQARQSFVRRFLAEARRQSAPETESPEIHRLFSTAAVASIGIALLTSIPLFRDGLTWRTPALVLCLLGGLLGLAFFAVPGRRAARRLGLTSVTATVAGLAGLAIAAAVS